MSLNKWKKSLKRVFHDEDCGIREITQTKGHLKIFAILPLGEKRMFVACITPSDNRKALLNFRADVRRAVRYERTNS